MFKERFQEILEFTKSESPYRKANKGWITQDIFLEFWKSSGTLSKQEEAAKITLLWSPIQRLIYNLLLIIFISSIIVLITLKEAKVNFNLSSFAFAFKTKLVQVYNRDQNLISEEIEIIDSNFNSEIEEYFSKDEIKVSTEELSNKEDALKSEDDISKDQITELEDEQSEEIKIKNDISITSTKKSKSNFL